MSAIFIMIHKKYLQASSHLLEQDSLKFDFKNQYIKSFQPLYTFNLTPQEQIQKTTIKSNL